MIYFVLVASVLAAQNGAVLELTGEAPKVEFGGALTLIHNATEDELVCSGKIRASDVVIEGTSTTVADLIGEVATLRQDMAHVLRSVTFIPPQTLIQEEPAIAGHLNSGLGQFASWYSPDRPIRFEWGSDYIQFFASSNPFVQRPDAGIPYRDPPDRVWSTRNDSLLIPLHSFNTSNSDLASWVSDANGAYMCFSHVGAWDVAWGIIPKDHAWWEIGCGSGGWEGRGAYYGEDDDRYNDGSSDASGWVGVKDRGQPKATRAGAAILGLTIKLLLPQ